MLKNHLKSKNIVYICHRYINTNINTNLAVQVLRKQYQNALRQSHFVEQQYVVFLLWKLNVKKVALIPTYKVWGWRSFYSRKKKSESKKKGFLFNLYLALNIWKPEKVSIIHGHFIDAAKGWELCYSDSLQKHAAMYNFIYSCLMEQNNLSLTKVTKEWLNFKPQGWVTIQNLLTLIDHEYDEHQLEGYMAIDSKYHGFQYKVGCSSLINYNIQGDTFNMQKNLIESKLSSKYLKVLVLRGYKYPVLYQYKYTTLITNLSMFGSRQTLPWELVLLPDGVWQLNPLAVKLVEAADYLTNILKKGIITEYLVKRTIIGLLSGSTKLSDIFRDTVVKIARYKYFIRKRFKKLSQVPLPKNDILTKFQHMKYQFVKNQIEKKTLIKTMHMTPFFMKLKYKKKLLISKTKKK